MDTLSSNFFTRCRRSLSSSLFVSCKFSLVLALLLVLIIPSASSRSQTQRQWPSHNWWGDDNKNEEYHDGPCEKECNFLRKKREELTNIHWATGDHWDFGFSCTRLKDSDERETCRNTCGQCPIAVCDPSKNPDDYSCPETSYKWPKPPTTTTPPPPPEPPREEVSWHENSSSTSSLTIAISIGAILLLIGIIACIYCCVKSSRRGGNYPAQGQVGPYPNNSLVGGYPQQQSMIYQQSNPAIAPGSVQPSSTGMTPGAYQQQNVGNYGQWSYPATTPTNAAAINPGKNG